MNSINDYIQRKNKLIFLTPIFFLILSAAYSDQNISREPETYILPEGYIGSFYIIFNVPSGQPRKKQLGERVYEIPASGVLLTQMDINPGWINENKIKFFYRLKNGALREITERETTSWTDTPKHRADTRITIFGGGIGILQGASYPCPVENQAFHVGTRKDILEMVNHFDISDIPYLPEIKCK